PPLHVRAGVQPAERRRVPADDRPANRVLLAAALLRAGVARRLREDLSVFLVPHTHWDREWYRPFQSFRISLVDVVDDVLDRLEAEPGLRFTLDGQLATVDDYLEIRPEAEVRIRKLVGEGRLAIGPWQTLMDRRRDHVAEPRGRHATRRELRQRDADRLSAGHVWPRRTDAADPPSLRHRDGGRVAGSSVGRRLPSVRLGGAGRLDDRNRVPAGRLQQCGVHPRRSGAGRPRSLRGAVRTLVSRRAGARDGGHRPHAAPT
ncbi:MAG: hypothetical protein E6G18_03850, partial [Actinobacteria bacterium]